MADIEATIGRPAIEVYLGENTAEAIRQADLAQSAAAAAMAAAGVGEYASTGLGLAGTSEGETFWVDLGNGLGQVYRHDSGPVATALHSFIIDPTASGAAALLGATGGSVQASLDALPTFAELAQDDAAEALGTITGATVQTELSARNAIDLSPVMLDLHYGVMRGAGFVTGDPGDGTTQYGSTFSAGASAGATSVTVASGTYFVNGQLIAFHGTDTKRYATRISTKSGTTLTLAEPLPADVSAGGLVGIFFNDYNHPREYGREAIADYIVDTLETANKRELVAAQRNWDDWKAYGGSSTVTAVATDSYSNPGSTAVGLQAANVAASTVGHGAISDPVFLPAGNYEVVVPVNPGDVGGARNTVRLFIEEEGAGTTTSVTASVTLVGLDSIQLAVIKLSKAQASRVRIYADGRTAGSFAFQLGAIRWYRVTSKLADLTSGTWVVMADSWGSAWLVPRLAARMPNANIINEYVSGNKASDMITRFDTDVTVYNPRVVLFIVGTNDWAASIDRNVFASQIQQLTRMCQAIGAQPVFLTCSVGDTATSPQLPNSRQYAAGIEYEAQNPKDQHIREGVYRGDTITVAAGAKIALLVSSIPVNRAVIVDYAAWAASVTGLNILMGFTGSLAPPGGSLDDEFAFGATTYETSKIIANKTDTSTRRYFMIVAYNSTGADQTLTFHNFKVRLADFYR